MTTLNPIAQFRPLASIEPASTTSSNFGQPQSLSQAVRQAVRAVAECALRRVAHPDAGVAFEPRPLLAVMTYCYANEIYGSADIEDVLRRDQPYRQSCQNEFPGARVFRRFRRENRQVLQSCLERVLRFVMAYKMAPGLVGVSDGQVSLEASRRIGIAMFMDSMEDWE
jgi:transposase